MTTNNTSLAYFSLRVAMGINLLGHGLARIPKLQTFAEEMTTGFEKSWLPQGFVHAFGFALPFIEFVIGLMLIIGFKTKWATIAGALLIITLLFGSSTIENWEAMGIQMIYALIFYVLIDKLSFNKFAVDLWVK